MIDQNDMQRAKENVMKGEGYLHIKRLPKNTVREIIEFFNDTDEFGGDWAMAMKHVWDTYKGMIVPKDDMIVRELEMLNSRIIDIENKLSSLQEKPVPEKKGKRMANGKFRGNEEK